MQLIVPGDFTLPFLRKEQIARDIFSFYFDRSVDPAYIFYPGQYNRVILPHESPDMRGQSRNFSIASSPNNKKEIMITTRISESSFKRALFSLTSGTAVQFFGPIGRFAFDETIKFPHLFLSGGLGITPFRSMLCYISEKYIATPITLIASFKTAEDILFADEFSDIAKKANVEIIYTITNPNESKMPWRGDAGRISEELVRKYVPKITSCLTFTCGPMQMVTKTTELLAGLGVASDNILKENFAGYEL